MNKIVKIVLAFLMLILINIPPTEKMEVESFGDVGICNEITANGGHNDECGEGGIVFENASFEEPVLVDQSKYQMYDESLVPGWQTTADDNRIEVWSSAFATSYTGTGCIDGGQCVEINATQSASLYQDFAVKPGQYIYYSFYHMGRSGTETLELRMGKPNDASGNRLNPTLGGTNDSVLTSSADKGVWVERYGIFQVPSDFASDGSNLLRISFLSKNNSSLGNLIDNVQFYTISVYDNELTVNLPSGGLVSSVTDEFIIDNTLKYFERDILATSVSSVTYDLPTNIDFIPGSLTVEGVNHSNYTISGNQLIVTDLPEVYEDINISYKVKYNTTVNIDTINISSYFEYASKLVVDNYPEYKTYDITDYASLNVAYNTNGYCQSITANNGYSSDCDVPSNIVYDNIIDIIDSNPSTPLNQRVFSVHNTLANLNTDKELDESTSTLKYTYKNNIAIDFSTITINGVPHSDYTNNPGATSTTLELINIPDNGVNDYVITFDFKYDFNSSLLRDVFSKEVVISSRLDYENDLTNSYVSDIIQKNLSYSTNIILSNTLTDTDPFTLLKTNEDVVVDLNVKNDSSTALKNVKLDLITDTSKLNNSVKDVTIFKGATPLVEGSDYTVSGDIIIINVMEAFEELSVKYTFTSLSDFTDANPLNNTVSAVADDYKNGAYLLQSMNIDVYYSSDFEVVTTVTDNQNGFAGNGETLSYTISIENTGSFDIKNIVIEDFINSDYLVNNVLNLEVYNNMGGLVSNTKYSITNNNLRMNVTIGKGKTFKVKFDAVTTTNVGATSAVANSFEVFPSTIYGSILFSKTGVASIPVSSKPTITPVSSDFIEINVNDVFDPALYFVANDAEDGNITNNITYTPTISTIEPGVHRVSLSVYDSDKRSATREVVVLVNDGHFVYGNTRIIHAEDFSRYVSEVIATDESVKAAAGVQVFDKQTGASLTEAVTVNSGSYGPVPGVYPITFASTVEPTTAITINGTVNGGNPPNLVGVTFKEIAVGGTFDPMAGISAIDDLDGDLTSVVSVSGSYNVNTAGIYKLTYSVTDSDNNKTTKTRILLVNDGTYSVGRTYILKSQDFTKRVGEVVISNTAIALASQSIVYDKQTGGVVNVSLTVNPNSYTAAVGTYPVTITITNDTTASRTVNANVVTGNAPVLTTGSHTEISVGGNFDPTLGLAANDIEDGDLTSNITYTGTYNKNVPGVYPITYSVTDSDLNTVSKISVLIVNDGSYEVGSTRIIQAHDFYRLTTEVVNTPSAIIAAADAKVFDLSTGLETVEVLSVNSNGYSSTIAIYPIDFTILSDPSIVKTVNAEVSNGHDPVINAESFKELPINSVFDPMQGVSAYDIEDGDLTSSITVINPVNTSVAGIYTVDYSVTDNTGNTTTYKTVVLINDGHYKAGDTTIVHASDFSILVSNVNVTSSAIINDASATLYSKITGLPLSSSLINVNSGTYTNVVGEYLITFTSSVDLDASVTIKGSVTSGDAPILTVVPFVEIAVGETREPLNYASAIDTEDGNLDGAITYTSNVDNTTPGFYSVEFKVVDLDGNVDTENSIVLVNDGSYDVGSAYVIQAFSFNILAGDVDGSVNQAQTLSNVVVYDKLTATAVNTPILTTLNGYTGVANTYPINHKVLNDTSATITIDAIVETGNAPIISGDKVTEIAVGDSFDPKSTMSALDAEDGDITYKGRVDGNVVTSVPGIYKIVYSVTDSDYNFVTYNRYVIVNDGTYVVTDNIVIQAKDYSVLVGDVDLTTSAIDIETDFKVYDIETESATTLPYTINTGEYRAEVGVYNLTYLVLDDEVMIESPVKVTVTAGNVPEFTGLQYEEINPGDSFDPMDNVTAYDVEDGDITIDIIYESNLDTSTVGVYTVRYSVIDSDDNEVTFVKVVVVGKEEHTTGDVGILYVEDFTKYVSEVDASESGILTASNYKVYSKLTGELVTIDVDPIITTDYTNIAGTYPINYTFTLDPAINRTITAKVISGNVPVITGESVVVIDMNSNFDISNIIKATDIEDGDITSSISISPTIDTTIHGVYVIKYTVTDSDNNSVSFNQTVVVNDGYYKIDGNYIIHNKPFVINESDVKQDRMDIINRSELVIYTLDGIAVTDEFYIDYNGYTNKEGNYTVIFKDDVEINVVIKVIKSDIDGTDLTATGAIDYTFIMILFGLVVVVFRKLFALKLK